MAFIATNTRLTGCCSKLTWNEPKKHIAIEELPALNKAMVHQDFDGNPLVTMRFDLKEHAEAWAEYLKGFVK